MHSFTGGQVTSAAHSFCSLLTRSTFLFTVANLGYSVDARVPAPAVTMDVPAHDYLRLYIRTTACIYTYMYCNRAERTGTTVPATFFARAAVLAQCTPCGWEME